LIQPTPTDHALQQRWKRQARTIGIASAIWAGSIFLSRIMGLLREQIIGRTLGASREADLYFASFTLPDFLNYLLAAGALSIVFIPIFLEYLERGDHRRGWEAFSVIANFILLAGGIGIALLMVFAEPLAGLVAPGFADPGEVDTLVRLIRIILPAQFFHVIGGLLSATLQAQDLHFLPAMAPLVYSAGIIVGGLVGAHAGLGADGFAWGVLIGSALGPFGLPLYGCLKTRMRWYLILSFRNADLRHYLWLSFPIMIGFSIVVVDEWIIKNQASYLAAGALSYLQYGRTLMKVPIGVFGMAAGVAAYPTISRLVAAGNVAEAYGVLCGAVRLLLFATFAAQVCMTLARVRNRLPGVGSPLKPIQRCGRASHRRHPGFSLPGSWWLGRANSDQSWLLCSGQHVAADDRRYDHHIPHDTPLYLAAAAMGSDRPSDR
jgi:putative peptidoglycan lipid II flippase